MKEGNKKMAKAKNSDKAKGQHSRLTIGLLASSLMDSRTHDIWNGVTDAARERGVNLICYLAGRVEDKEATKGNMRQALVDLVSAENLDGLITFQWWHNREWFESVCHRFRDAAHQPWPIVNCMRLYQGYSGVAVDNYQSMRPVIEHLIEVHRYRRIAYVGVKEGHATAEARYRAYVDVLTEHDISVDQSLVMPPDYAEPWFGGAAGIRYLLDEQKLQPKVDIEAVVFFNDAGALEALDVLQKRGVRVPYDMAVVGFDNIKKCSITIPPLTTAAMPNYQTGKQAVETLLAKLEGEQVSEQVIVPAPLMIRQSCGCLDPSVAQAKVGVITEVTESIEVAISTEREQFLSNMKQAANANLDSVGEWTEHLLEAFVAELTTQPLVEFVDLDASEPTAIFLSTLDEILRQVEQTGGNIDAWQDVLSAMRRDILPYLADTYRADDLWQQGQILASKVIQQAQARKQAQTNQQAATIRHIGLELLTTFDMARLADVLARNLPQLGIPSCYLSLYENPDAPAEWSRLILAYDQRGQVELEEGGRRFASAQLVPEGMLSPEKQYNMVVEPLYFGENQFGFVLFEVGPPEGSVYEALREEISNALQGTLLMQGRQQIEAELEQAYAEVERQVKERTAELFEEIVQRKKAEKDRERLQQEIIEAQKLVIRELSSPVIPIMNRIIVVPLIGSIDSIRARDITRSLLVGISAYRAKVVILDVTGVPIVDSGVANYLYKTIQAARLKGAYTIVTGISDAVAETIVDLGIDWSEITTLSDLQTGLVVALDSLGVEMIRK
ncbi:substrate-binding domain-containing protein [Chloroflexota bacterium]